MGDGRDRGSRIAALLACLLVVPAAGCAQAPRPFADRSIAWNEHDDDHVPRRPATSSIQDEPMALLLSDSFTREIDRRLALERPRPAADVNAADEVPCSTWFCPRNHLHPMSPEAVTAGPPEAIPPVLPLTVMRAKGQGATPGFVALDSDGRKHLDYRASETLFGVQLAVTADDGLRLAVALYSW